MSNEYPNNVHPRTGQPLPLAAQASQYLASLRVSIGKSKAKHAQYNLKAFVGPRTVAFFQQALIDAEGAPCMCSNPLCKTVFRSQEEMNPSFDAEGNLETMCELPLVFLEELPEFAFFVVPVHVEPTEDVISKLITQDAIYLNGNSEIPEGLKEAIRQSLGQMGYEVVGEPVPMGSVEIGVGGEPQKRKFEA